VIGFAQNSEFWLTHHFGSGDALQSFVVVLVVVDTELIVSVAEVSVSLVVV
jgi:hypothetical protein